MHAQHWRSSLRKGKKYLTQHENEKALNELRQAVSECPVDQRRDLAKTLYYLGITLHKLGMSNCALKSWCSAQQLVKVGLAYRCLRRYSNAYGMARQQTQKLDDWKAFYAVHLYRYLSMKRSRKLGTDAERDMIWDLIREAWHELTAAVVLSRMTAAEKIAVFNDVRIVFPSFTVSDQEKAQFEEIPVDFTKKRRIYREDACFCGSGLPYKLCCGRIPGEDELTGGVI